MGTNIASMGFLPQSLQSKHQPGEAPIGTERLDPVARLHLVITVIDHLMPLVQIGFSCSLNPLAQYGMRVSAFQPARQQMEPAPVKPG